MTQHGYNVSATFVPTGYDEYYDPPPPPTPDLVAPAPQRYVEHVRRHYEMKTDMIQSYA